MKESTREAVEKSSLGVLGVVGSWGLHDVSLLLSIILTIVMIGWVLSQWAKFMKTWWREEKAREGLQDKRDGAPPGPTH